MIKVIKKCIELEESIEDLSTSVSKINPDEILDISDLDEIILHLEGVEENLSKARRKLNIMRESLSASVDPIKRVGEKLKRVGG